MGSNCRPGSPLSLYLILVGVAAALCSPSFIPMIQYFILVVSLCDTQRPFKWAVSTGNHLFLQSIAYFSKPSPLLELQV